MKRATFKFKKKSLYGNLNERKRREQYLNQEKKSLYGNFNETKMNGTIFKLRKNKHYMVIFMKNY